MSNITVKQTSKTILFQPSRCQFVTYKVEKTDKENYSLEKIYQKMAPNKNLSWDTYLQKCIPYFHFPKYHKASDTTIKYVL